MQYNYSKKSQKLNWISRVAWPLLPTDITTIEADTTIRSEIGADIQVILMK
jgi:hypothetical protein